MCVAFMFRVERKDKRAILKWTFTLLGFLYYFVTKIQKLVNGRDDGLHEISAVFAEDLARLFAVYPI